MVEETAANQLKKPGVNANDNKASVGLVLVCLKFVYENNKLMTNDNIYIISTII